MNASPVIFTNSASQELSDYLQKNNYDKIFILCDSNTIIHCLPLFSNELNSLLTPVIIPAGEENKTYTSSINIMSFLAENFAGRKSLLINLGGGVVTDIGGFCASVYMRGIDYINIPTSLIGIADASIGGKTGVNLKQLKNYIGTFYQPELTIISTEFLSSLPDRELISGWAEIIKTALLFDNELWQEIKNCISLKNISDQKLLSIIKRSVHHKIKIVTEDPNDLNIRNLLNFGHTVGHAIESYFLETNNPVLHGEAIAAGIIAEAYISVLQGVLSIEEYSEIKLFLKSNFPSLNLSKESISEIIELCRHDKKNDIAIRYIRLKAIANAEYNIVINENVIKESLLNYIKS